MGFKPVPLQFAVIGLVGLLTTGSFAVPSLAQEQAPQGQPAEQSMPDQPLQDQSMPEDATGDTPVAEAQVQLIGLGDSLMAGYQLQGDEALTSQLEKALHDKGMNVSIGNAGVSGDTTEGGLARVDWSVPDGTQGVILELGANDALRGIAPEESEKNLSAIIEKLQARKIGVLLVGMIAPPNMGADYAKRFNPLYQRLAEKYKIPLYPFILDGVVTDSTLKLGDGMHPNAKGVGVMVERMLPAVQSFAKGLEDKVN
ncbi:arylesterase [Agrobacterium vitis]|uniref:Arylesterase n=2 Tax=Agrobacterium vitis TaxID=373 RepID=A0AAE4WDR7_AGRVI|nr:arylesterase [Allorhizobium sp. Av2]MCM2440275.1 arylesterase [Agrobacterium vitis]MUZ58070.1 arylesterase [Agrobacterium vitis]MVA66032.1 arylesterase [Agrobacterium vitis]MVA86950.1 arylesterase [Agrobacterium vitis]